MPHQTSRLPPWPGTEYYTAVREFDSALQRIAVHYHLKGLACEELDTYVAYRLTAAGSANPCLMTRLCKLSIRPPGDPAQGEQTSLGGLDLAINDLFCTDGVKSTARFSVLNLRNKVAMYNFLSICAGTHFWWIKF